MKSRFLYKLAWARSALKVSININSPVRLGVTGVSCSKVIAYIALEIGVSKGVKLSVSDV